MKHLIPPGAPQILPAIVAAPGESASLRILDFLAASIRNSHPQRDYTRGVDELLVAKSKRKRRHQSIARVALNKASNLSCKCPPTCTG